MGSIELAIRPPDGGALSAGELLLNSSQFYLSGVGAGGDLPDMIESSFGLIRTLSWSSSTALPKALPSFQCDPPNKEGFRLRSVSVRVPNLLRSTLPPEKDICSRKRLLNMTNMRRQATIWPTLLFLRAMDGLCGSKK